MASPLTTRAIIAALGRANGNIAKASELLYGRVPELEAKIKERTTIPVTAVGVGA